MTVPYTADIIIAQGDSLPLIEDTLQGFDGAPIDLSGCTVHLKVVNVVNGQPGTTVIVDDDATPDPDQINNKGKVYYQMTSDQMAAAGYGDFFFRWQPITFPDSNTLSVPNDAYFVLHISKAL